MIKVEHVTKRFGRIAALDDISFNVRRGEIVGLLGPNGAGKTTMMRILTGYLAATEGQVRIGGRDVFTESLAIRRHLGYLPENVPLYPELRVDEYLTFRARLKGVARRRLRRRLQDVKEMCGLEDAGHRVIGSLSRGYWQRIGLADALIHDPSLLILDEPTIGLDPNQNRAMRELILSLGRRYTILLSTHFLAEAALICQQLLILRHGKIVAADSPLALLEQIPHRLVIRAEIFGVPTEVKEQLAGLPGVQQVSVAVAEPVTADSHPAWHSYQMEAIEDAAVRVAVFELVARNRWTLRELTSEKQNLEDVFAHVTSGPINPALTGGEQSE